MLQKLHQQARLSRCARLLHRRAARPRWRFARVEAAPKRQIRRLVVSSGAPVPPRRAQNSGPIRHNRFGRFTRSVWPLRSMEMMHNGRAPRIRYGPVGVGVRRASPRAGRLHSGSGKPSLTRWRRPGVAQSVRRADAQTRNGCISMGSCANGGGYYHYSYSVTCAAATESYLLTSTCRLPAIRRRALLIWRAQLQKKISGSSNGPRCSGTGKGSIWPLHAAEFKRRSNWLSSTLMADDSSSRRQPPPLPPLSSADDVLGSRAGSTILSADYSSSAVEARGSESLAVGGAAIRRSLPRHFWPPTSPPLGETPPPSAAGREVEADNAEAEAEQLLAACRLADEVLQESWSMHRRSARSPYLPVPSGGGGALAGSQEDSGGWLELGAESSSSGWADLLTSAGGLVADFPSRLASARAAATSPELDRLTVECGAHRSGAPPSAAENQQVLAEKLARKAFIGVEYKTRDFKPVSMGRRQSVALALIASAAIAAAASGLASLLYGLASPVSRAPDLSFRRQQRRRADLAEAKARFVEPATERAGLSPAEEAEILALPTVELVRPAAGSNSRPPQSPASLPAPGNRGGQPHNCAVPGAGLGGRRSGRAAGRPARQLEGEFLPGARDSFRVGCSAPLIGRAGRSRLLLAVAALKALGGVPFVRTAVPQSMMSSGIRARPVEAAPGGSSSGEAALVAGGGSPLRPRGHRPSAAAFGCLPRVRLPASASSRPTPGRSLSQQASARRPLPGPSGCVRAPGASGSRRWRVALLMSAMCSARPGHQYRLDPELPPLDWAGRSRRQRRVASLGYFVGRIASHLFDRPADLHERRSVQLAKSGLGSPAATASVAWRLPDARIFSCTCAASSLTGGVGLVLICWTETSFSPRFGHSLDTARTPRWCAGLGSRGLRPRSGVREGAVWVGRASALAPMPTGGRRRRVALAQRLRSRQAQVLFRLVARPAWTA
uniref:Amidase domain-containing protein n=1 Tax=Macrostomum lignano TaxID=282301 RepID=A0A1I8FBR7_9PLAT